MVLLQVSLLMKQLSRNTGTECLTFNYILPVSAITDRITTLFIKASQLQDLETVQYLVYLMFQQSHPFLRTWLAHCLGNLLLPCFNNTQRFSGSKLTLENLHIFL